MISREAWYFYCKDGVVSKLRQPLMKIVRDVYKPSSVLDDHLSGPAVASRL